MIMLMLSLPTNLRIYCSDSTNIPFSAIKNAPVKCIIAEDNHFFLD